MGPRVWQLPFGLGVTRAALNVSLDACWYLDEVRANCSNLVRIVI